MLNAHNIWSPEVGYDEDFLVAQNLETELGEGLFLSDLLRIEFRVELREPLIMKFFK